MKKTFIAAATAATLMVAAPANAGLVADINFDQQFGAGDGFGFSGFGLTDVYSIETRFSFDDLSGYTKIIDFKGLTTDDGWYNINNRLNFYDVAVSADNVFQEGVLADLLVTRDAAGMVNGYVNGELVVSFDDTASQFAVFTGDINMFIDDNATGGSENSSGFLSYVRLYDMAITPAAAVPEPATWAMMIFGFGLVGGALRRRKTVKPVKLAVSYS